MALNYPGPLEVRLFYTCDFPSNRGKRVHQTRLSFQASGTVSPGDLFADIDVLKRLGTTVDLQTSVTALVNLLKPLYNATYTTFDYAECWKYTAGTFESIFISSMTIAAAGTGGSGNLVAGQDIYTFRTFEGGIFKLSLQENIGNVSESVPYAGLDASNQALVDFFTADANSHYLARDTSYPLQFLRLHPGTNEALFKDRYR